MYILTCTWIAAALTLLLFALQGADEAEAKRLYLRPLNAREVMRVLRDAGRENAVPEGRVVSQGLAALTGFTLGLTKGIGGSILYDIVTANITQLGGTSNNTVTGTAQEICFTTRSARSLDEEIDDYNARQPRADELYMANIYGNDNDYEDDQVGISGRQAISTGGTGNGVSTSGPVTNTGTGTATNTNNGSGTSTQTFDTTTSGQQPVTNCIVIQK